VAIHPGGILGALDRITNTRWGPLNERREMGVRA
jgi:hypothetical protein